MKSRRKTRMNWAMSLHCPPTTNLLFTLLSLSELPAGDGHLPTNSWRQYLPWIVSSACQPLLWTTEMVPFRIPCPWAWGVMTVGPHWMTCSVSERVICVSLFCVSVTITEGWLPCNGWNNSLCVPFLYFVKFGKFQCYHTLQGTGSCWVFVGSNSL